MRIIEVSTVHRSCGTLSTWLENRRMSLSSGNQAEASLSKIYTTCDILTT